MSGITFWQAGSKLTGGVLVETQQLIETKQLPADAATAVAVLSHIIHRGGITLVEWSSYRATWIDADGDHEVSLHTPSDHALVEAAIRYRKQHPEAETLLDTRNLLIRHDHFPQLIPFRPRTRA